MRCRLFGLFRVGSIQGFYSGLENDIVGSRENSLDTGRRTVCLEQARVHYLHELGLAPTNPGDIGMIIAEASCRFKSPLRLREQVTIRVRVSQMRRSSFTFVYRMEGGDGRLAALARTVQVCYDYDKKSPVSMSDEWREAIVGFEPGLPS